MDSSTDLLASIVSGVAVAAATALFSWVKDRNTRPPENPRDGSAGSRADTIQEWTRIEDAHAAARQALIPEMAKAKEWLEYQWGLEHGGDADWYPDNEPVPQLTSVAEVIRAIGRVATEHPTKNVRTMAREFKGSLSGHYGAIHNIGDWRTDDFEQVIGPPPSGDLFAKWVKIIDALIESMHGPALTAEAAAVSPNAPHQITERRQRRVAMSITTGLVFALMVMAILQGRA